MSTMYICTGIFSEISTNITSKIQESKKSRKQPRKRFSDDRSLRPKPVQLSTRKFRNLSNNFFRNAVKEHLRTVHYISYVLFSQKLYRNVTYFSKYNFISFFSKGFQNMIILDLYNFKSFSYYQLF